MIVVIVGITGSWLLRAWPGDGEGLELVGWRDELSGLFPGTSALTAETRAMNGLPLVTNPVVLGAALPRRLRADRTSLRVGWRRTRRAFGALLAAGFPDRWTTGTATAGGEAIGATGVAAITGAAAGWLVAATRVGVGAGVRVVTVVGGLLGAGVFPLP